MTKYTLILLGLFAIFYSCNTKTEKKGTAEKALKIAVKVPDFNSDSAYYFTKKQVDFGPRVPNTAAHNKCENYLVSELKRFNTDVIEQKAEVTAYNGKTLKITNIIGQFNPNNKDRILLFAHWDTRPFSDHSGNPALYNTPILGASDGASGIAILLEIARQFSKELPGIGVDLIFFDAEDYGTPDHLDLPYKPDAWCLGTQYWTKHPHKPNYYAKYGILLDMVGAKNAIFTIEGYSNEYASWLVDKVWGTGTRLGYSNFFDYTKTGSITDDHVYVNSYANIPSIDIIQYDPTTQSHFGWYWHTENDNMDVIDKNTLKAIGQTLIHVIYNEK